MPMYLPDTRICKICSRRYNADVLVSSNTFSQRHQSIMREFKRHRYWLCDDCWEQNQNKPDDELEIFIPNEYDFEKLENLKKTEMILWENKIQRFNDYSKSIGKYYISNDTYTSYLKELFSCLSTEIVALNKPYKLYLDYKELNSEFDYTKKTIGYLFDPRQRGPNISIYYDLKTYSGNVFHMFPKIIIDSGYSFHITYAEKTMISKTIYGRGFSWNIDIEMHKKIRELLLHGYSWMDNDYFSSDIQYLQHIYFETNIIDDLIKIFDNYYDVLGEPFEKIREIASEILHGHLNEKLEISNDGPTSEMRLFNPPFTDVKE